MHTRKKYSEEFKLQKIKEYMGADVPMRDFCNENQLNYNSFRIWYYEFKKQRKTWDSITPNSNNSTDVRLAATAFGELILISMPSFTG